MESKRIVDWIAGILVFLSIVMTFAFLLPNNRNDSRELSYDEALSRIKNREIAEVVIKQDKLEPTSKSKEEFITKLDSVDAARAVVREEKDAANDQKPEASNSRSNSGRTAGAGSF